MTNDKFERPAHPAVDPQADALLKRAYSLADDREAQSLYAEWADTYDRTMLEGLGYKTPQKTAELLLKYLAEPDCRILDVGAGTGLAGVELRGRTNHTIDALDYSPQMLAVANHRGIYRHLIEADLNQPLAIASETYDAMICTGTFTHAHVGATCLHELLRILKPGGHFACTVHKEVWNPMGFADVVAELEAAGTIQTLHRDEGTYYAGSEEPEGWYIVWQKL